MSAEVAGTADVGDAVRLRPMTWRDIPMLAALEAELFGVDAWSEPTWWAELAGRPRRSYVVADASAGEIAGSAAGDHTGADTGAGGIAGYAGIDRGGDVADVMTIAVAPHAQGRGLGARLLRHVVEDARAGGARRLMLEVRADNAAALRLYQGCGFTTLTVRRRYYQPGNVDALVMRLDLEEVSA